MFHCSPACCLSRGCNMTTMHVGSVLAVGFNESSVIQQRTCLWLRDPAWHHPSVRLQIVVWSVGVFCDRLHSLLGDLSLATVVSYYKLLSLATVVSYYELLAAINLPVVGSTRLNATASSQSWPADSWFRAVTTPCLRTPPCAPPPTPLWLTHTIMGSNSGI